MRFEPLHALTLGVLILAVVLMAYTTEEKESDSLMVLRASLGEEIPDHYIEDPSEVEIRTGYQLIHEGRANRNGSKSQYISRFYTCVSCHNTVREDPDLTKVDQEARLQYAVETGIPYLQGSTFWGIVNRTVWYNDDYVKKYGKLVVEANKSLQASIQLCAQECSQGRELEEWEMQAILVYLSTLDLKVADLGLSEAEIELLNKSSFANEDKLKLLDSKYLDRSPATFSELPSDKQAGYPFEGRTDIGRHIYEISCQYCHKEDGVSDLVLDNSRKTFKWLKKNIRKDMRYSLYEIIRKGTYAEYGHREYMPHYTLEKMSHQQVEDLRAYVEQQAD